ncbi:hypothetical protein F5884DRAFT_288752 [Xylogone sp. PMI_703]|nr:hypothetical protein F5884DRAFT_288752 [Xylogone sp. PMI_703]
MVPGHATESCGRWFATSGWKASKMQGFSCLTVPVWMPDMAEPSEKLARRLAFPGSSCAMTSWRCVMAGGSSRVQAEQAGPDPIVSSAQPSSFSLYFGTDVLLYRDVSLGTFSHLLSLSPSERARHLSLHRTALQVAVPTVLSWMVASTLPLCAADLIFSVFVSLLPLLPAPLQSIQLTHSQPSFASHFPLPRSRLSLSSTISLYAANSTSGPHPLGQPQASHSRFFLPSCVLAFFIVLFFELCWTSLGLDNSLH